MTSQLTHIGTNTRVGIVAGEHYDDVPAKVDTGADLSSIWASNISKVGKTLSFRLFGPGYVKYSGKTVRTTEFKRFAIKNSFGTSESRYRVKLKILLGSNEYEEEFTLANRSNNSHPILLGKTFLSGRFVVDVSKGDMISANAEKPKKVLVLTTGIGKKIRRFYDEVATRLDENIIVDIVRFKDLRFEFLDTKCSVFAADVPLTDYSMVYIKSYKNALSEALALAKYCKYASIACIDDEVSSAGIALGKLSEMVKLKVLREPVIDSVVASSKYHLKHQKRYNDLFGYPLVVKDAFSDRGENNFVVFDEKEFADIFNRMPLDALPIVQRYVPNDGYYRILMLGYKPKLCIYRGSFAHKDHNKSHLNKPAGGVNSVEISIDKLEENMLKIAKRSTKITERSVAGIDMIKNSVTGKWYVLEVNNNPSMISDSRWQMKAAIFADYISDKVSGRAY